MAVVTNMSYGDHILNNARNSEQQAKETERRLRRAKMVAHLVSPLVAATFAIVYWVVGMYNVMFPGTETGEM